MKYKNNADVRKIIINRLKKLKLKDVVIDESDNSTVHVTINADVEAAIDRIEIKLKIA
jgi:citrate lyase gamma subunit